MGLNLQRSEARVSRGAGSRRFLLVRQGRSSGMHDNLAATAIARTRSTLLRKAAALDLRPDHVRSIVGVRAAATDSRSGHRQATCCPIMTFCRCFRQVAGRTRDHDAVWRLDRPGNAFDRPMKPAMNSVSGLRYSSDAHCSIRPPFATMVRKRHHLLLIVVTNTVCRQHAGCA